MNNMLKISFLIAATVAVASGTALAQTSTVTKEVVVKTTGSNGTTIQTGTQTTPLTLVLPTTAGTVNQGMIVTNVSGNTVTLGWPSSGESPVLRMRRTLNIAHALGNGAAAWVTAGSNVGNTPMSATVVANTSYHIYIMFLITETGDAGANDAFVDARITLPSGTFSGSLTGTTNNNGHAMLRGYSGVASNTLLQTLKAQDVPGASGNTSAVVIDGYVDIGAAGGTLSVQITKDGNANTDNYIVGAGSFLILER